MFSAVAHSRELRTERLLLRIPVRADVDALDEAVQETLDALVLWLPWAHPGHTRADSRRYLRSARLARKQRHSYEYAIERSEDANLLGMVSLHRIDWVRRSCGLGYWIRRAAWGRGFATEAARGALLGGFQSLGLHRIEVHVALENAASLRVVEKLRLQREGIARGFEYVNGRYLDHVQYSLLNTDALEEDA